MLTIWGAKQQRFCDRLSRRDFLQVGTLGVGGLTLGDLLRRKAQGAIDAKARHKAVIMIYLAGGPSHIDMYDMKPDAPVEIRGEFKPIQTNVPGMEICEHMPQQAKIADKFAIIRGLKTSPNNNHGPVELLRGFGNEEVNAFPSHPTFGSVVSRLCGAGNMPASVSLATTLGGDPGYLGPAYRTFGTADEGAKNLGMARGMTLDRLADRKALLRAFDNLRQDIDHKGELAGVDAFTSQALELVTSTKARDAFDVSREPDNIQRKYGSCRGFLQARRLVEAGVSVVTLQHVPPREVIPQNGLIQAPISWDTHEHNFEVLRAHLPVFDAGVHALITDLSERGLAQDVAVVMWGEWGRSPRVGRQVVKEGRLNGRDHWNDAGFVFIAGGGLRMGQAIKDSGPRGERSTSSPYTPQNVLATLYHVLGIDPEGTLPHPSGRPMPILQRGGTIAELV